MKILLSPHNDDETLFAAYTLIRHRPRVIIVTDSYIQFNRGDNITAEQRREETMQAMEILGCPVEFWGLRDDKLSATEIVHKCKQIGPQNEVFAPAVQGGNPQHDLVGQLAQKIFPKFTLYTTYTRTELWTRGTREIVPTENEKELKLKALACYQSQINLLATRHHFEAVMDKSEWYL
jgi:LmbE family N-acetylglucosaminyl deacetylase